MTAARTIPTTEVETLAGCITLAKLGADILRSPARSPHRAGRDWCRRHSVPYRLDGKHGWVRVSDVEKALEALYTPAINTDRAEAVASAVARMRR